MGLGMRLLKTMCATALAIVIPLTALALFVGYVEGPNILATVMLRASDAEQASIVATGARLWEEPSAKLLEGGIHPEWTVACTDRRG